jgi:prepilin-type N-terminal cleavage/methylation domain-containing protein
MTDRANLMWRIAPLRSRAPRRPRVLRSDSAAGFTLVELLVAIAIIGTLVALLLPAVQSAREAARRASCISRMKQIALATINYEQARQTLPAAGDFPQASEALNYSYAYWRVDLRTGRQHGWLTRVLPYMEQQALFDQFDFNQPLYENARRPQAEQPESLLCPSDQASGRSFEYLGPDGQPIPFGKANYAAFASPYHVDGFNYPGAVWLYGVKAREIVDGASTTLLLGEIRTRDEPRDARGAWALPWAAASLLSVDMHPLTRDYSSGVDSGPGSTYQHNEGSFGVTQTPNALTPDVLYECPDAVAEQVEAMPCSTQYWGYISAAPRSHHPAGVHVAYVDGRVEFMGDGVDEIVMAYAAAINDETFGLSH